MLCVIKMPSFIVRTKNKKELVDVTSQVKKIVSESKVREGICLVFARHATAAIVINENADPNFRQDVNDCLDKLIPEGIWLHDQIDDNGAAHLKSSIVGPQQAIPVVDGKLALGTWQGIGLLELDGPREREVVVIVK